MPILLVLAALLVSAEAAPRKRQPANRFQQHPAKVYTLACRGEDSDNAIALVRVVPDAKDPAGGAASGTVYLRETKGFRTASVSGRYLRVGKDEEVLALRDDGGAPYEIFLDPAKESSLPGLADKQPCEVTGELESR
jgi:hypothetical protein